LKEKMHALQKDSSAALDTMKEGLEKATAELKSALDKVISRFK